jgi:dihydromethanopterin reductase (acceptor)
MMIIWCITGGEYMLAECVALIEGLPEVTVAFSAAGAEVAAMYGLAERIVAVADDVIHEGRQGACSPVVMRLHEFEKVVVAPCTANTAAKVAHGIADSLVSNVVSQALKLGRQVIILPTDAVKEVTGKGVDGGEIKITCRDVDLKNVEELKRQARVVYTPGDLGDALRS